MSMVKNMIDESSKEELIKRLSKTGLNKKAARVLLCIDKNDEIKSVEIESETGLRQPEVSIGVQDLKEKGWISKRNIKKSGKGRPEHAYSLNVDLEYVISDIEKDEREKIKELKQNIEKIKELVSELYE